MTLVDMIGIYLIGAWMLMLGIGAVWAVLLPLRIAARIAWAALVATWAVGALVARLAAWHWRRRRT